jgi:hypothetical protein
MSRGGRGLGLVLEEHGDREPEAGDDRAPVEVVADLEDADGRRRLVGIHLALIRIDGPDEPGAGPKYSSTLAITPSAVFDGLMISTAGSGTTSQVE